MSENHFSSSLCAVGGRYGDLEFFMTYKEIYYSIIENRKKNPLPKDEYGEIHHIKPKCLGGSNEDENLVKLTAAEHYRCHYYLVKIYENGEDRKAYQKMVFAFNRMSRIFYEKHITDEEIEELSKLYGELREAFRQQMSEANKGKHHSEETRRKMSEANKGKGHKQTDDTIRKISQSKKGICTRSKDYRHSNETKNKIGNAQMGKHWYTNGYVNVFDYECPEGYVNGMTRRIKMKQP